MRMALSLIVLAGMATFAAADSGPSVVIPSRAGVPIMINGVDASYAVVEGDWGLGKSVHVQPTVYGGWPAYLPQSPGRYFPRTGHRPGYGRYERTTVPRSLPGSQSYYRSWSAESPRGYEPLVPADPPPVIYAPRIRDQYGRSR